MKKTFEPMVVEVKELGTDGLNVVVFDLRSDEDATFTTAVSGSSETDAEQEWERQFETPEIVQYVDHEWRNASIEYTELGLVKTGAKIERINEPILVSDPSTLEARLVPEDGRITAQVCADGVEKVSITLSYTELGVEKHPEFS